MGAVSKMKEWSWFVSKPNFNITVSLLMRVKEESEKAGLKFSIQNSKIMASSPITASPIDGEKLETVTDFIILGFKITTDNDCSHKINRQLFFEMKGMTRLYSVLRSRDITLLTKVHKVKGIFFPLVMYGCESWTINMAECPRIDAFKLWSWRRPLRVLVQQGDQTSQS